MALVSRSERQQPPVGRTPQHWESFSRASLRLPFSHTLRVTSFPFVMYFSLTVCGVDFAQIRCGGKCEDKPEACAWRPPKGTTSWGDLGLQMPWGAAHRHLLSPLERSLSFPRGWRLRRILLRAWWASGEEQTPPEPRVVPLAPGVTVQAA